MPDINQDTPIESTQEPVQDNIKDFYNSDVAGKGYFKDEAEFRTFISDPKNSNDYFKSEVSDKGYFKDAAEFDSFLGVKKKDGSSISTIASSPSESPSGLDKFNTDTFSQGNTTPKEPNLDPFNVYNQLVTERAAKKTADMPISAGTGAPGITTPYDNTKLKDLEFEMANSSYDEKDIKAISELPEVVKRSKDFNAQGLLDLKKTNPTQFGREIAHYTWGGELANAMALKAKDATDKNNPLFDFNTQIAPHIQANLDYAGSRENNKYLRDKINEFFADDESTRKKLLTSLSVDAAANYDGRTAGTEKAITADPRSSYLNKNQILALNLLEDTNPEQAAQFNSLSVNKNTLDPQSKLGYEDVARKLEVDGLSKQITGIDGAMADIKNNEARTNEDVDRYNSLLTKRKTLTTEYSQIQSGENKSYTAIARFDSQLEGQDIMGLQNHTGFPRFIAKTAQSIGNAIIGTGNLIASLGRDDSDNYKAQLFALGHDKLNERDTHLIPSNSGMNNGNYAITKNFKKTVEDIMHSDKTEEEKLIAYRDAKLKAPNDTWFIPSDPKLNMSFKAAAYGISDMISMLVPIMATEGLGSIAGLSKLGTAGEMTNTFISMISSTYQENYAGAIKEGDGSPELTALRRTAIQGAFFAGLKTPQAIRGVFKVESAIGDAIKSLTDTEIEAVMSKTALSESVMGGLKASGSMSIAGTGAEIINAKLDDKELDPALMIKQVGYEFAKNFLTFSLAGLGFKAVTGNLKPEFNSAIFSAAADPDGMNKVIDTQLSQGKITEVQAKEMKANVTKFSKIFDNTEFIDKDGKFLNPKKASELFAVKLRKMGIEEFLKSDIPEDMRTKADAEYKKTKAEEDNIYGQQSDKKDGSGETEMTEEEAIDSFTPEEKQTYLDHITNGDIDSADAMIEAKINPPKAKVFTENNIDEVDQLDQTGKRAKILFGIKQLFSSVKGLVSETTGNSLSLHIHDDPASFQKAADAFGASSSDASKGKGFYMSNSGEIHINMNNATPETLSHEIFHPVLEFIAANNPEMLNTLYDGLKTIGADKYQAKADASYVGEVTRKKEAITDFIAHVADGTIKLDASNYEAVRNYIAKVLDTIGVNKVLDALGIEGMKIVSENYTTEGAEALKNLATTVSSKFKTGEDISTRDLKASGFVSSDGQDLTNHDVQFSVQNDFSDRQTKTTFRYIENTEDFDALKAGGFITNDKKLDDFKGKYIFLHSPDNAFTGDILKNGEMLIKGNGGVYYPIKFHKDGYFWASTEGAATSMARLLNETLAMNPDGKIYMGLTSAPADKLLSSTTASNGVLDFFSSKVLDNNIKLSEATLKKALITAAKDIKEKKTRIVDKKTKEPILDKNGDFTYSSKKIGLGLSEVNNKMFIDDIRTMIKKVLNPDNSTFADRKNFTEELINNVVDGMKGKKSEQLLGNFLKNGLYNGDFKGETKGGFKLSKANVIQSLSHMLSEPMLRGEGTGKVYAIIELGGKVEPVRSDKHESYPMAIKAVDMNQKVKLHILQDRMPWNEHFADPETGTNIKSDREKQVYPTSGVTIKALKMVGKSAEAVPQFSKNPNTELVDGFYSPIEDGINELKQEKGTGEQMLAMIKKGKGITKDELEYTGIEEWLKTQKSVTKPEILDYLKKNRIEIKDVTKGTKETKWEEQDGGLVAKVDNGYAHITVDRDGSTYLKMPNENADKLFLNEDDAKEYVDEHVSKKNGSTKYDKYTLPGGENYKEVLITLPGKDMKLQDKVLELEKIYESDGSNYNRSELDLAKSELEKSNEVSYRSSHYSEPNILAHLRMNTRVDAEGKKVLHVEEVQSDWGQSGKKQGFAGEEFDKKLNDLNQTYDKKEKLQQDELNTETARMKELLIRRGELGLQQNSSSSEEQEFKKGITLRTKKIDNEIYRFENALDKVKNNREYNQINTEIEKLIAEKNNIKWFIEYNKSNIIESSENIEKIEQSINTTKRDRKYQVEGLKNTVISKAPYVTKTDAWVKLSLKKALQEAVAQGVDKVSWTTGEQQFGRWGSEEINWKTIQKPVGGDIVIKDIENAPVIRGNKIVNLASIGEGLDPKSEIQRIADKWGLKPDDFEFKAARGKWEISLNEQTDAEAFAGNEAGSIDRRYENGTIITSKEDLEKRIQRVIGRDKTKEDVKKLTDRVWERMLVENSGTSMPRKEGMQSFYGEGTQGGMVGKVFKQLVKDLTGKEGVITESEIDNGGKYKKGDYSLSRNSQTNIWEVLKDGRILVFEGTHTEASTELIRLRDERFSTTQPSIEITPELKAAVEEGVPQFSKEQTNSEKFKDWFGDWKNDPKNASKAVDSNGEPKVYYHGTSKDVDYKKFNINRNGAWFSDDPKEASNYAAENDSQRTVKEYPWDKTGIDKNSAARVFPVYLDIKKLANYSKDVPIDLQAKLRGTYAYKKVQGDIFTYLNQNFKAGEQKYDGIDMGGGILVVLDKATQIKSAIGNNGEFSKTNDKIQFSKEEVKPTNKTESFFNDAEVMFPNDDIRGGYAVTNESGKQIGRVKMSEIDDNTIKIDEVVSEKRGQRTGNGSAIMKMVVDNADKNNVKLILTPNLIGEMKAKGFETADKLRSFYEKFGFVKDKGKATMTREPKIIETKEEVKPTEEENKVIGNLGNQNNNVNLQNGKDKGQNKRTGTLEKNTEQVRYNGTDVIGQRSRPESEKAASRKEAKEKISSPDTNASLKAANDYNKSAGLPEIQTHEFKPSDKDAQTKIGETYQQLQDVTSPDYKETELERQIFDGYKSKHPELFEKSDIKSYKDLVEKSYAELAKEADAQFKSLPIKVEFHEGDHNYESSAEMLDDVHNFGHLWVFKGGDDHTLLGSKTADKNGITANDKFRAVHDYFGHSTEGYQFGKDGEENAWIEHSKMFSPLAQVALSSETRGQNSVVNYSGINDVPLEKMKTADALTKKGLSENNPEMIAAGKALLNEANNDFQFAEQKSIVLPEKYTDAKKYFKEQSLPNKEVKPTETPQFSKESEDKLKDLLKRGKITKKEYDSAIFKMNNDFVTSTKNKQVEEDRKKMFNTEMVEKAGQETWGETFDRAKEKVDTGQFKPSTLVNEILKEPRPISAEENAILLYDRARLFNERLQALSNIERAYKNKSNDIEELQFDLAVIEEKINNNDEASTLAGTETGRALAARAMMIAQDYTLPNLLRRYKAGASWKGKFNELTKEQEDRIKGYADTIADLQNKLEKAQKNEVKTNLTNAVNEAKKAVAKKAVTKGDTGSDAHIARKSSIIARMMAIKNGIEDTNKPQFSKDYADEIPEEYHGAVKDLFKEYVSSGATDPNEIIDNMHTDLQPVIDKLSVRGIRDFISQYGVVKEMSKDALDISLRDMRRQLTLISKIEDAENDIRPLKTGLQRDEPSNEVRNYQQKLNDAIKKANFKDADSEKSYKSALDGIKKRLSNQITDLENQINTGERRDNVSKVEYDAQANDLVVARDILKKVIEDQDKQSGVYDANRIKKTENALGRAITKIQARIRNNELEVTKNEGPTSNHIELLKDIKKQYSVELLNLQKEAGIIEKRKLAAYKNNVNKRIGDYEERIKNKDYSKKSIQAQVLDTESMDLKKKLEDVKFQYERDRLKHEMDNEPQSKKNMRKFLKIQRSILLSSIAGAGKIATSAGYLMMTKPLEELAGSVLRHIPGIKKIAEGAPREGGGFNPRAEALAITKIFSSKTKLADGTEVSTTLNDLKRIWQGNKGELETSFSKKVVSPQEHDFFGQIHAMLKYLPKQSEVYRSMEIRFEHAIKNGEDISDPSVYGRIVSEAVIDGNRTIFMGENMVVGGYKSIINYFDREDKSGTTSTVLRFLFPIVKVPSNYIKSSAEYLAGAPIAVTKALWTGVDNLDPSEKDTFMRLLKKQSVGAAFFALGYFGSASIGGYYTGKRKEGDVKDGEIRIFGHDVPKFLAHAPIMEVMQFGATIRRLTDAQKEKGETPSYINATATAGLDLIKESPFITAGTDITEAAQGEEKLKKYAANKVSSFIPADIKKLTKGEGLLAPAAKIMGYNGDIDSEGNVNKRRAIGFIENIEMNIPGVRESQVPLDYKKIRADARAKIEDQLHRGRDWIDVSDNLKNKAKFSDESIGEVINDSRLPTKVKQFKNAGAEAQLKLWTLYGEGKREELKQYLKDENAFKIAIEDHPELLKEAKYRRAYNNIKNNR